VLEFKVLGRLHVLVNGQDVPVTDPVDRILLMGLLVNANAVVDPVEVVGSVWDEEPDLSASPQASAGRLKELIDGLPGLVRLQRHTGGGYQLIVDEALVDYRQAKAMYLESKRQAPMQRAEMLRDAFALWPESFEPDIAWSRDVDELMESIVTELDIVVRTMTKNSIPDDDIR
jgi:hypothetical protein